MRYALCPPLAVAVWASAGCSLITDWNANKLPCKLDDQSKLYACLSGYTCAPGAADAKICVADHSLSEGDACWNDAQCPPDNLCPTQQCSLACANASVYKPSSNCPVNAYCAPHPSTASFSDGAVHTPELVAVCQPSDTCQVGSSCTLAGGASGGICVGLSNTSRACLVGCEITYTANAYSDNCRSNYSCVPVGPTNQQQTVCVRNDVGGQAAGGACSNSAGQPCPKGYLCANGVCAPYCETQANSASTCASGQSCCSFQLNAQTSLGYCASSCP